MASMPMRFSLDLPMTEYEKILALQALRVTLEILDKKEYQKRGGAAGCDRLAQKSAELI